MIDRRRLILGGVALAAMPVFPLGAALPIPAGNRLGFDILRKGAKLGTHVLTFEPGGSGLTVHIAVELTYKLLGVTLYHYRHRATEVWSGDQVTAIDCRTDDNGSPYQVTGRREAGGFAVTGTGTPRYIAPADALPATHWNRRELDGPWINTQNGHLIRPKITPQGVTSIPTANGGSIPARHYALSGEVQLDIFYDDRGWAGLSFVKGGAPIVYERQS
jgi:hypothetical protein